MSFRPLVSLVLVLATVPSFAQLESWVGTAAGPTNTSDEAVDVAVDTNGFAAVAGNSGGDLLVAKFNRSGALLWSKRYNGPGNGPDTASAVTTDGAGNVYVTGKLQLTATAAVMATIKFAAATGGVLWVATDASGNGEGRDVLVTPSGAVVALGSRYNNGFLEMVVAQYAATNGAVQWSTPYDSAQFDTQAASLGIDSNGALYGLGTRTVDPIGSDFALMKLSSVGVVQWSVSWDGSGGFDAARDMVIDSHGYVYCVGRSQFYELDDDFATVKIRQSDGGVEWKRFYDGFGAFTDEATSVTVGADGSAYVGGWLDDGRFYHVGALRYSPAGTLLYDVVRLATKDIVPVTQGVLDPTGNFVVSATATSGNTRADFYTFSVAPDGSVPWYRLWNDDVSGNDVAAGIAVDGEGNLLVAGTGFSSVAGNDFKVVRYQRVTLTPAASEVTGGANLGFTLALNSRPPFAAVFTLSEGSANASLPASATVPTTGTSAAFVMSTTPVATPEPVTVTARSGGAIVSATVTIKPPTLTNLTLAPSSVVGGLTTLATLTLNGPAPAGGLLVPMWDSHAAAQAPAQLTVPAGATTGNATIPTTAVAANTTVNVWCSLNGSTRSAVLTLTANGPASITVTPNSVVGGTGAVGTVTLNSPAANGGTSVNLSSSSPAATVPASVSVPVGQWSATFPVNTTAQASTVNVTLTATRNGITRTAALSVVKSALSSLTLDPNSVTGGTAATGLVTLTGPAPAGGYSVTLTSNSAARATVPASVSVPAGATSAIFAVSTLPQTTDGSATITANLNAVNKTATLTVLKPTLAALILTPNAVQGGQSVMCIAVLTGAPKAGTAGITVALTSGGPSVTVPASVRIPAGATSVGFLVQTSVVAVDTPVTITGTAGTVRTTTLVVMHP